MHRNKEPDVGPVIEKTSAEIEIHQTEIVCIDENGFRSQLDNRQRRRKSRQRRGEHLVARAASQNPQRDLNGVQTARYASRMPHPPILSQLDFKGPQFFAQNVAAALQNSVKGLLQIPLRFPPLPAKIVGLNHKRASRKERNSA